MKYCLLSFLSILAISCGAGKSSSTSSTQNASNSNKDNILVSNNQDPNSVPTQPESQSLSLEEFLKKFSGSTPYTAFNLNSEYKITKEHLEKINEDYKRYDWSRLVIPTKISFQPAVFENNKKYDSLPVSWFSAIEKATISERDVHITKNIQSLIKSHQEGELLIIIAGQQHSYDTYWNDPKQAITYFFHPLRSDGNPYLFEPRVSQIYSFYARYRKCRPL